jgi:hypothetical protein
MSSMIQTEATPRTAFSLLLAIAFFGVVVAAAIASPHYLPAPSSDVVLVGP